MTAVDWAALRTVDDWVHRAAHLLANGAEHDAATIQADYQALLDTMRREQAALGNLAPVVNHFHKVTTSYGPHLFHWYRVTDLPATNNALEQYFGAARYHERRATGRKGALPGLVVRGQVRVIAAVAARTQPFDADTLRPPDLAAWRTLRQRLQTRHDARRAQRRFRHDPPAYLAALEEALIKPGLPA